MHLLLLFLAAHDTRAQCRGQDGWRRLAPHNDAGAPVLVHGASAAQRHSEEAPGARFAYVDNLGGVIETSLRPRPIGATSSRSEGYASTRQELFRTTSGVASPPGGTAWDDNPKRGWRIEPKIDTQLGDMTVDKDFVELLAGGLKHSPWRRTDPARIVATRRRHPDLRSPCCPHGHKEKCHSLVW